MNRRSLAFSGLGMIALLAGGYFFGIPFIVDGNYPDRTQATRYFSRHHSEFESLYRRLEVDGHSRILCYADDVRVGPDPHGFGESLTGQVLEDYLALCSDYWVGQGWRIDDAFLFYLGGSGNRTYGFNIALIRYDFDPPELPNCEQVEPSGEFGKCQFDLGSSWRLDYEWMSHDYVDSFSEKAD